LITGEDSFPSALFPFEEWKKKSLVQIYKILNANFNNLVKNVPNVIGKSCNLKENKLVLRKGLFSDERSNHFKIEYKESRFFFTFLWRENHSNTI